MQETQVWPLGWEDPPREWNGNPIQYSCLENSMDKGIWQAAVHGVAKSQTPGVTNTASQVGLVVKNPPVNAEDIIRDMGLGQEDPLE